MAVIFETEKLGKHAELTAAIKSTLKYENGKINIVEGRDPYIENLPEGITEDQIKILAKYNNDYTVSSHIATGEVAHAEFQNDSTLAQIVAKFKLGGHHDSMSISVKPSKTQPNQFAKPGQPDTTTTILPMRTTWEIGAYGLSPIKKEISAFVAGLI